MRKLIPSSDGAKPIPVRNGLTVGSEADNGLCLSGPKVQDRHAVFSMVGPYVFIEDLDSDHGTLVNGKKIRRTKIQKGDKIEIGGHALTYDEDDQPEPEAAKPAASATKAPAAKPAASGKAAPAVQALAGAKPSSAVKPAGPAKSGGNVKPGASSAGAPAAGGPKASGSAAVPPKNATSGPQRIRLAGMPQSSNAGPAPGGSGVRDATGRLSVSGKGGAGGSAGGRKPSERGIQPAARISDRQTAMLSSTRLSAAADEAARASISARSAPADAVPFRKMTKIGIAVMALLVAVPLIVVVGVPQYKRWQQANDKRSEAEKALEAALERMLNEPVKDPADLKLAYDILQKRVKKWDDLEDFMGPPALRFQDKIRLWDSKRGSYFQEGIEFRAYYVKNPLHGGFDESANILTVLLYEEDANERVNFLGTRNYAKEDAGPLEVAPDRTSQPTPENPPTPEGTPAEVLPGAEPGADPVPGTEPAPGTDPAPGTEPAPGAEAAPGADPNATPNPDPAPDGTPPPPP
ncbi:MAG: hypothetical protein AMXMBFR7_06990 [Planctomycetota bacterium]